MLTKPSEKKEFDKNGSSPYRKVWAYVNIRTACTTVQIDNIYTGYIYVYENPYILLESV